MAAPRRVIELGFTEEDVVELNGLRVRGQKQPAGSFFFCEHPSATSRALTILRADEY